MIIDKESYSAFHKTELDNILKSTLKRSELIIVGTMTNCCCASTARSAFDYDYKNWIISDLNTTISDELQVSQLKVLAYGVSYVISNEQLLTHLKKKTIM